MKAVTSTNMSGFHAFTNFVLIMLFDLLVGTGKSVFQLSPELIHFLLIVFAGWNSFGCHYTLHDWLNMSGLLL
jgi:hypothetical protein